MIKQLTESAKLLQVQEFASSAVRTEGMLSLPWLESRGWLAVPIESGGHLTTEDIEKLTVAKETCGLMVLYGVQTEVPNADLPVLLIDNDANSLRSFNSEYGSISYLLFDGACSIAILCSYLGICVVSSDQMTLTNIWKIDVVEAFATFREFVRGAQFLPAERDYILGITEYYWDHAKGGKLTR